MDYDTINATIMAMERNTNPDYSFAVRVYNRKALTHLLSPVPVMVLIQ
jgi:hypothetical protein